jgi:hypothetical protein
MPAKPREKEPTPKPATALDVAEVPKPVSAYK